MRAQPAEARRPHTNPPRRRRVIVAGRLTWAVAWTIVALRHFIVLGWLAAAVAAATFLPGLEDAETAPIGSLVPTEAEALRTEARDFELFGFPLLSRTAIVQRDPEGMTAEAQARAVTRAIDLTRNPGPGPVLGALPVPNTLGLFPGSRERSTTVITFLYFPPGTSLQEQVDVARTLAEREMGAGSDALVGVTGAAPAREAQEDIIVEALPQVEGATVALIALVVAVTFHSIGAPLVTLITAAVAFVIATRVVGWAGIRYGLAAPPDLEPVMVALLLGIVTDYAVFYLSGMRTGLASGLRRVEAARQATREVMPIIVTAGLLVAGGSAALLAGRLDFLRAFGPALALTVLVALAVTVTLLPALLGILGRATFWPVRLRPPAPGAAAPEPHVGSASWRGRFARRVASRPVAFLVATLTILALGVPILAIPQMQLGFRLVEALPADAEAQRALEAAEGGFAPGILSPTVLLLELPGIAQRSPALGRLEGEIERRPGVAGVVGAGDQAFLEQIGALGEAERQDLSAVMVSRDGNAARFAIILEDDPLGGDAISALRGLRRHQGSECDPPGYPDHQHEVEEPDQSP